MTDPTPQEFSRFVHMSEHLLCEKGGQHPPVLMLPDCWFFDRGEVPEWASRLAEANAPGWTWCPWLKPELLDMTEAEQAAWVDSVLARARVRS